MSAPTTPASSTPSPAEPLLAAITGPRPMFGVTSSGDAGTEADRVAEETGCRPAWRGLYVALPDGLPLDRLTGAAGVPVVTLLPQGRGPGIYQPAWTLASTVAGAHDAAYLAVARTIVAFGGPVAVRFAPEFNGAWSAYGIGVDGNTPAQYVAAWRHVVSLFRAAGAANVLWMWAPNVVRGATVPGVAQFWPGDRFVDLVGVTGYGYETTAGATYDRTLTLIRRLTAAPVVLAEMGAAPGRNKSAWIASLGPWLAANPQVIGLIWTDEPKGPDAHYDWRWDDTEQDQAAFTQHVVPHLNCTTTGGN